MERPSGKEGASVAVEREAFKVARDQSTRTIAELQKRCDALAGELENFRRQREEAIRKGAAPALSDGASLQLAEAQKAILSIRQARDSVLAHNQDLTEKLSRTKDQIAELRAETEVIERARDRAIQETQALGRECDELRRKTLDMTEQRFAALEAEKDRAAAFASAQQQIAALKAERDAERMRADAEAALVKELRAESGSAGKVASGDEELAEQLAEARHKLADLEAKTEGFRAQQKKNIIAVTKHLTADREALRAQFSAEKSGLEAQIAALQAQVAAAESGANPRDGGPLAERVEQQRMEIAELNGQLEVARTEISDLRASLDQARAIPAAATSRGNDADANAQRKKTGAPAKGSAVAKVSDYDASAALGAMSSCLQMLNEHPTSMELLEELDNHLHGFAERAAAAGLAAVHRFSSTCGELTRWLRKVPAKINPSTLLPLEEAVDFLAELMAMRNPAKLPDPTDAFVFAVDDDPDNCECIAMSLEKMRLRTRYAIKPEVALVELAANPCDLVILDVDMPGMDGFELASRIRKIEHHAHTPIVLLSALSSTKERLDAEPGGADAFIPKPYNLNELGLRTLGLILKARLKAQQK